MDREERSSWRPQITYRQLYMHVYIHTWSLPADIFGRPDEDHRPGPDEWMTFPFPGGAVAVTQRIDRTVLSWHRVVLGDLPHATYLLLANSRSNTTLYMWFDQTFCLFLTELSNTYYVSMILSNLILPPFFYLSRFSSKTNYWTRNIRERR
jgi:hypothetical protein